MSIIFHPLKLLIVLHLVALRFLFFKKEQSNITLKLTKTKKLMLPDYYTNISPLKESEPEYSVNSNKSLLFDRNENYSLDSAKAWLNTLAQSITKDGHSKTQDISLSSFCSKFLESNLSQHNINV